MRGGVRRMTPGVVRDVVNITRTFKRQNAKNLLIAVRLDCHPRELRNLGTCAEALPYRAARGVGVWRSGA